MRRVLHGTGGGARPSRRSVSREFDEPDAPEERALRVFAGPEGGSGRVALLIRHCRPALHAQAVEAMRQDGQLCCVRRAL